ncbi:MAG: hypothetical protein RR235_09290 [Oscillospiraceae bacterium]
MRARIKDFVITIGRRQLITLETTEEFSEQYDVLKDKDLVIELKPYRRHRSTDANAYSWLLTDKLSDFMLIRGVKLSKDEMHAEMIFRYGQPMLDPDGIPVFVSTQSNIKAIEFYPYLKEAGCGEVDGKAFTHFRAFRGSHTYDTQEMSVFIAGIVEECKEQGIETKTPEEIERIEALWKGK